MAAQGPGPSTSSTVQLQTEEEGQGKGHKCPALTQVGEEFIKSFHDMLKTAMQEDPLDEENKENDDVPMTVDELKQLVDNLQSLVNNEKKQIAELKNTRQQLEQEEQERTDQIGKEAEAIRAKKKKEQELYQELKAKCIRLENDCTRIKNEMVVTQDRLVYFGPILKSLKVDVERMACGEGKPIDMSGAGGTCNIWQCPKVVEEMDKASDDGFEKEEISIPGGSNESSPMSFHGLKSFKESDPELDFESSDQESSKVSSNKNK